MVRRSLARLFLTLLPLVLVGGLLAPPARADEWYRPTPSILGAVDAGHVPKAARQAGVGWDRVLFLWQEIQPYRPDDWYLDRYLDQSGLRESLESGLPIVAVVQGTPGWAAGDWHDGASAVPTGLDYPPDDPNNHFGRFMRRLAAEYKGQITAWIIWNEPDIRRGESGNWWTWAGNYTDFGSLMRAGYRAVKSVDPTATVLFPATTYYADAVNGRELFLSAVLRELAKDPNAAENGFYFDALGLNLYCSLNDIYRVRGIYAEVLARHRLAKPIWLTETNCPVHDDASAPMPPQGRITTSEQAAFLVQAIALARAAGYARIGWYGMLDHDPLGGVTDRYGLLRADRTPRPAYRAFETAARYLGSPHLTARFAPFGPQAEGGWSVWRVVLDDPAKRERIQVLWRTPGGPDAVRLLATGATSAFTVDPLGRTAPARRSDNGTWLVPLPPVRASQPSDPPGFLETGHPIILVEHGFPALHTLDPPPATY